MLRQGISVQSNVHRRQRRRASRFSSVAPFFATGVGLIAVALLVPVSPSKDSEARIFSEGLSVEIDRSSPAFAALEDATTSLNERISSKKREVVRASIELVSGRVDGVAFANHIRQEIVQEERQIAAERLAQANYSRIAAHGPREVFPVAEVVVPDAVEPQAKAKAVKHPTKTISLSDLKVSREELFKSLLLPLASTDKRDRNVAKNSWQPSERATGSNDKPDVVARQTEDGVAQQNGKDEVSIAEVRQLTISGPIEFSGGVALTSSNDRVVVFREEDGESMEPGAVWLRDARYEIFVNQPVGTLVAELRASSGEVLGRGKVELETLKSMQRQQYRVDAVKLKIGPVAHGITVRVHQPTIARQPVAGARVELEQLPYTGITQKDGQYTERDLIEGSNVVLRAARPGHWGTLAFARAGQFAEMPLFSDKSIDAIAAEVAPGVPTHSKAVVWGRVTRSGKAVEGARVELMTTENELRPVYFNAMNLPDSSLTSTSANGLYAFFPVQPGAHAVQAIDMKGITEPVVFPADANSVTSVDLELAVEKKAKVRVFDSFRTDWPLAAELVSVGRDHGIMVDRSGETTVRFNGGTSSLILDADAGKSYDRVRISVDRNQKLIDVPMVQSVWLDRMRGSLRINQGVNSGTVVGFIQGQAQYRVALDESSVAASSRVLYFNSRGEVTGSEIGQPGGGFVIFNVPEGHRTVLVQFSGSSKVLSSTALVESGITNVITHRVRN